MAGVAEAGITYRTYTTTILKSTIKPLTTPFTFASSCTETWIQSSPDDYPVIVYNSIPPHCYPYSTSTAAYSPGVCPSGQSIAGIVEFRHETWTEGAAGRYWVAGCCKAGFTYDAHVGVCEKGFTTPLLAYKDFSDSSYADTASTIKTIGNLTVLTAGQQYAQLFQVYWEETDLSDFDPAYASSVARRLSLDFTATTTNPIMSGAAVPGNSLPSAALPTSNSADIDLYNSSQGTSKSRIVGVAVGASVGVMVIVAATCLILFWIRRRKMKQPAFVELSAVQHDPPDQLQTYKAELP